MARAEDTSAVFAALAIVLAGYGIYVAAYVPAMLIGEPVPVLLLGFVLQAAFALAAAFGVWTRRDWAALAIILLGVSIALTALAEAFVLGIVAYLHAIFVAVAALIIALSMAAYIGGGRTPRFVD